VPFRGVLVFAGIVVVAAVVLVVAAVAAAVGFGLNLVMMPWLMPLVWILARRRRSQLWGARFEAASPVRDRGGAAPFTSAGRGPIPVH
jgi:hypothetical protein